jgi:hypothetical protein
MPTNLELEKGVKLLAGLSESDLELELGRRLNQTAEELVDNQALTTANPTGPTVDQAVLQNLPDSIRKIGERFWKNFNRQMYSLVCDETDPDNAKLRDAAGQGMETLGYVLSGVLVATFGWLPGIATVVAVLIAKRIAKSGYQTTCELWKEQL